jgi:hypothetical protein
METYHQSIKINSHQGFFGFLIPFGGPGFQFVDHQLTGLIWLCHGCINPYNT